VRRSVVPDGERLRRRRGGWRIGIGERIGVDRRRFELVDRIVERRLGIFELLELLQRRVELLHRRDERVNEQRVDERVERVYEQRDIERRC
jgi:hypothetical protein